MSWRAGPFVPSISEFLNHAKKARLEFWKAERATKHMLQLSDNAQEIVDYHTPVAEGDADWLELP